MNLKFFDSTTATLLFLISVYISFHSNGRENFWRMFCSLLVIYHVVVGRGEVGLFLKEKVYISNYTIILKTYNYI